LRSSSANTFDRAAALGRQAGSQTHDGRNVASEASALVHTFPFAVPAYMRSEPSIGSSAVVRTLIDCELLPVMLPEMSLHEYALPTSPVAER